MYDITDLLEQPIDDKNITRTSTFRTLIKLYFEGDIEFTDLKLEQIFIKDPSLIYDIDVCIKYSHFKDTAQKLLNIIDVVIKNEKIRNNPCLTKQFLMCLCEATKNKEYSDIKKMLEYGHYFPAMSDYLKYIVEINDAEILKIFAESKLLLYVDNLDYYEVKYTTKAILPALGYAILEEKNDAAVAIIKSGTNLNETEAYYKLEGYNNKGLADQKGIFQYLADISYNASENNEYYNEKFLSPLFYAVFLRNHEIIDQLLAAGANNGYSLEDIYNELEKDLKDSPFIKKLLQGLRKDASYNAEITAKLQQTSVLTNE